MMAGWNFVDAFYMVIITAFGVGYGEVHPIEGTGLKFFTIGAIFTGCTSIIYITGAFIQFLTEGQILRALGVRKMTKELNSLNKHAIVCGFGRIGRMVATDLTRHGYPFVIIEREPARYAELRAEGYYAILGDATSEATLKEAGIERAASLATVLPSDAANVFITLSARNLNRKLHIIARGIMPETEGKLKQAGADRVVLPAHIGAERIASHILHPSASAFMEDSFGDSHLAERLSEWGVHVEEIPIPADSSLVGSSLETLETRGSSAFLIVAIRRQEGLVLFRPSLDTLIRSNDVLVVMCHDGTVPEFTKRHLSKKQFLYRGTQYHR